MGMIKQAIYETEESLGQAFNCVDVALHQVRKAINTGLYNSDDLQKVAELLLSCHTLLEEEEGKFLDIWNPEQDE